jgi:hypothetical protein
MKNDYYTYAYLRKDGTPYYIGKGRGRRAFQKWGRAIKTPPQDRILLLKTGLTEEEAFRHEIYMIAVFGRKDIGTGILYNFTDGGEGTSGWVPSEETRRNIGASHQGNTYCVGRKLSEETKEKIRQGNLGKVNSPEARRKISEANSGKKRAPLSEEHKQKLRQANLGKKQSLETRKKRSEAMKGNKNTLGTKQTAEHKEKIRQALKGKPKSPEHREKISQALKRKKGGG